VLDDRAARGARADVRVEDRSGGVVEATIAEIQELVVGGARGLVHGNELEDGRGSV
jgi:hypothetical protein